MQMNLNDSVRVQLTEEGKRIFYEHCHRDGMPPKMALEIFQKHIKSQEFQLWELMNIFGKYMYNGNPNLPFVNNTLEIIAE